ncbi:hypothetical protein M407DRAFT_12318 [Tulasnella calospora MUT 4182]|uniref:Uncharacterized protein n=1 Tax=Tulasnella calospora MUT 4182 TaxID=1051891 RepID=A0A0C3Q446_9AGAM|nr:hypothetical protein M407DRAFT_12318 [Tulasnella calospora MUT 4182]
MTPSPKETLAYLKANHENALHLGNDATPDAVCYWAKPLGGDILVRQKANNEAPVENKSDKGKKASAAPKADSTPKAKKVTPAANKPGRGNKKSKADPTPTNTEEVVEAAEAVYLSVVGKIMADGSRLSGAGTFFATPADLEEGDQIWGNLLKARYTLQLGPPTEFESEKAIKTFGATIANANTLENMAPKANGILHKGFVKEDKYIRLGFKLFRSRDDDDDDETSELRPPEYPTIFADLFEVDKITREWPIGSQCEPGLRYAIDQKQVINLPRMFNAKGTRIPHDKLESVIGATVCVYFTLEHMHIKKGSISRKAEASFTATLQELHVIIPAHSVPTSPSKRLRANEQMFGSPSPTKKRGQPSAGY